MNDVAEALVVDMALLCDGSITLETHPKDTSVRTPIQWRRPPTHSPTCCSGTSFRTCSPSLRSQRPNQVPIYRPDWDSWRFRSSSSLVTTRPKKDRILIHSHS
uniref:Uncharacterized protein n=1 Tax=Proboscia inermis TaxID=420281 RepID=A0A7S0C7J6_9STRA